ncbi:MAG: hypothetical protein FJ387_20745, partial [Verrucomicrobia bacterium]|nr:hypothetical protein [Verrucomicrobiota bacterium]
MAILTMNARHPLAVLATSLLLCFPAAHAETPIRSTATRSGPNQVLIAWEALAGKSYQLRTTTSLLTPWQVLATDPAVLQAQGASLSYTVPIEPGTRFFQVVKLDTEPPQIVRLAPVDGAIAVGRGEPLEIALEDETGIDTGSITLAVGAQSPVRLSDTRLTYTNRVLVYRPGGGELYGDFGQRVAVRLTVADTLGNRLSDQPWSFELERQTTLVEGIRLIGQGRGPGLHAPGTVDLTLLSVSGNLYTYRYSGASAGLSLGEYLVDSSYSTGYILQVQQALEDPSSKTVVVLGRVASLAELVADEGSVRFRDLAEVGSGVGLHSGQAGAQFSLPVTFPLGGTVLYEDAQAGFKVEITDGVLELIPALEAGATFKRFRPEEVRIDLSGTVRAKVVVRASGTGGKRWSGSWPLMKPKRYVKGAMLGWVPVWVEAVVRVDLGYEVELEASGYAQAGVDLTERFGYQVRYANRAWTHGPTRSDDLAWFPPEWQVEGDFRVRGSVEPLVKVYIYILVGGEAGLSPYVELAGDWQLNPVQVQWGLWWGVPGHIGVSARVWDADWGTLPTWEFDLVPRTLITEGTYRGPAITRSPADVTVAAGQRAWFSVEASGPALRYQWQKDGLDVADSARISGARGSWLEIRQAQPADAGLYRVRVSNGAGWAMSGAARLTVQGGDPPPVAGMAFIPAGSFQMGDTFNEGTSDERPVHTVYVSAFYMDRTEVTKALWDEVYGWAVGRGYSFDNAGSGKAANHPVQTVYWYDMVKWCNARSEKEGRMPAYYTSAGQTTVYRTGRVDVQNDWVKWNAGYRLPTEAEWEKAARGGASGRRFPWTATDTITHSQANYYSHWEGGRPYYAYDVNPTGGYHPTFAVGASPYTSPVGYFAPNGYGLYDMAGNVWEWCWDWYSSGYYGSSPSSDPRGSSGGSDRVIRGGS